MAIIDTLLGKFKSNRPQQNDTLNTYLQALPDYDYAKPLLNEYTPEQLQMGVRNNLNFGVPEIADWQQQYNQGAGRNNPLVTPDNPEQFKQDLKSGNTAQFSLGANSSPSIWNRIGNKIGNSINDFTSGYKENVSTPFAVENLERGNKSFATRAGELGGTLRRFADTSLARGLITAGLVGATGGGALPMLALGVTAGAGRQYVKTQDQVYRKQLQNMGIDTSNIGGNITKDIYDSIISGRRLQQMTYGQLAQFDSRVAEIVRNNPDLENAIIPTSMAKSIYGLADEIAKANIENKKADTTLKGAKTKETEKKTEHIGKEKPGKEKLEDNPEFRKNLAFYVQMKPGKEKQAARSDMIAAYGVDPDKKLGSGY